MSVQPESGSLQLLSPTIGQVIYMKDSTLHCLGAHPEESPQELQWPVLRQGGVLPFYVETNFKPPRWLRGLSCLWLRSKPDHLSSIS